LCPAVQVVQRQVVPGDIGHVAEQFAIAVDKQREAADEVGLGGIELSLRRALLHETRKHLTRHRQRLFRLVGAGLQPDRERTRMQAWRKTAVDAVTQAAFFAHLGRQARDKAATAQNVVAHRQREKIGIVALVAGLPQQHVRLG